jgi:hypothetical protein
LIYLGLGLVAIAAIALSMVFSAEGDPVGPPPPVESVSPHPGDLVPSQSSVKVDLQVGYQAEIYIDGWLMPDAVFTEATGVHVWTPSPTNPTMSEWTPGSHTVRVVWDTVDGLADPGEYEWSFRIG